MFEIAKTFSKAIHNCFCSGVPSSVPLPCQSNGHLYPDSPSPSPPYLNKPKHPPQCGTFKSSLDTHANRIPSPLANHDKADLMEPNRKHQGPQSSVVSSPLKREPNPAQNRQNRPLERFTPEAFAQNFHQAVLQSTHSMLQNKG